MLKRSENNSSQIAIINLTAFWAFSEGFLGGILNALKIPFKGLFLGSISVIVITLIASFSDKKGIILRTGIIVMIIKLMLSPYTSLPAYFAVFVQTLLGELFFLNRSYTTLPAILLGIITSAFSSIQRIVVLTLVMGNAFWDTIDQFTSYIYNEFFGGKTIPSEFKFSNWLVGTYIAIHCIVGFIVGLYASRLSSKIKGEKFDAEKFADEMNKISNKGGITSNEIKKNKSKIFRATKIILYGFLLMVLILSYVLNEGYFDSKSVWIMLFRSLAITVLWFKIVAPVLQKIVRKKLMKRKDKYSGEVQNVLTILPFIKKLFVYAHREAGLNSGFKKITSFIVIIFTVLLKYDFTTDKIEQSVPDEMQK